jgi:hypothetical protein
MRKTLSLALGLLLLYSLSPGRPSAANALSEKEKKTLLSQRVKAEVRHLGAGKSSAVRVVLYDKTKYHGHIAEVGEDSFVVADAKTGRSALIAYSEVKGIKGNNLSTGAKIGIGLGAAAAAAIIIGVIRGRAREEKGPDTPCQVTGVSPENCPPGCICVQ